MAQAVLVRASSASWTVLAGSLPAGAPAGFYADLVRRLREVGGHVAVDTSDAPLQALVDALPDSAPDLMKPNGEELASFTGGDPEALEADPEATAKAARQLIDRGVGTVLATLGGNGAVLVTAEGAWHATPPPTTVVSTVGAGDSSLFGYLLGDIRGLPAPERLALAVAYGSAAAGLPGTTIPLPSQLKTELVGVTTLGGTA
jgi:1-phosphofructokinase